MQFYASVISVVKVSPHKFGKGISMQIYSFLVYLCSCTTTKKNGFWHSKQTTIKPCITAGNNLIFLFLFLKSESNFYCFFAPAVLRLKDGTEKESISQERMDSVPENGNLTSGGCLVYYSKEKPTEVCGMNFVLLATDVLTGCSL